MKQSRMFRSKLTSRFKENYVWISKKEKSLFIDQFFVFTGFIRNYESATILRNKVKNNVEEITIHLTVISFLFANSQNSSK